MVQKNVNPTGLRLGHQPYLDSRCMRVKRDTGKLRQDASRIPEYLSDKLKAAGVSRIVIERPHKKCRVTFTRPSGVVIGKKGADSREAKSDVQKYIVR